MAEKFDAIIIGTSHRVPKLVISATAFRGLSVGAQENMGAAWYIPTFIVPALLL